MPLFRQLNSAQSGFLGLIANSSVCEGKAVELEAVLELQINEFSAFVNVKADYRQNMLGASLCILKGRSLNALLLQSGRA